ncbi:MAG TPA: NADH-quinone oxidoreductase subunit NuoH [Firmicutes bacterium]|nr:NADH-quinone oxidoreductase subunit NuoH [Bacillota bacterium]
MVPAVFWALVKFALILGFMMTNALVLIWLERKVSGRIQRRLGPMRVGRPQGWLQTTADALKLLFKEDLIPPGADRAAFVAAPMLMFVGTLLLYVVVPFGPGLIVRDLDVGVLYFVAVGGLIVLGMLAAGWGSNNKYSLLGAMRSTAQMLSYEVPLVFAVATVTLLAGTMSVQGIVAAQARRWFIFLQPVAFLIYLVALLAELNRTPFDLSEAESELVAGYNTEYSGIRWSMFFLAEYANLLAGSAMAATLFLGGWSGPWLPPVVWFALKTYFLVFVAMWLRWTVPRIRMDQLMALGWKVLVPISLVNLVATGAWVVMR